MTEHSLLGASSAHRWLNCPGSFKLSQTAPHRPASIYAATGTLAHELIEQAARAGTFKCDETELGQSVLSPEGHNIEVTQELIDGVNVMVDYLRPLNDFSTWMEVEFRVDLGDYFQAPLPVPVFGTVDAAVHTWRTEILEIVDYKNGAGIPVTPVENPQLMFYGAGVLNHPEVDGDRVKTVKLTIVQPNAGGIRSWEIDVVDLLMWIDDVLVPGVEACTQDDAPLNPGSWCRFCPVSHACPKLMADAIEMAKAEFDDTDPSNIQADYLPQALDVAERAELWITRMREFAVDQLQHQVRIPGWALVPTRPTRKWTEPDADIAKRLETLGASIPEIWETQVRSPAQLEKVLNRAGAKGRRIWETAAARMVELKSSGVKLGRDGTTNAREDFDDGET